MEVSVPKPPPTPVPAPAPATSSGRSIGRYVLFDEIAVGGMATVHLGRLVGPVGFARTVAIKRLHPQFSKDPDFGAMFLDEAHLAARIRHPNVVPTIDVVQTDDELFIVMEYVQGESLARLVRKAATKGEQLPLPVVAAILSGVLHGLHAAHEAKNESGEPLHIVHRDVSPQNILVGVDGTARLLDFGVAKAAQRMQTTREGQIKGKVAYMSPEQLTSDVIDRRSDVFAAGVVLWEAVTGKRLFEGASDMRVLTKIMHEDSPLPSTVAPGTPPAFDAICARALSRDPSARFSTAREMALAIEQATPLAPPSAIGALVEQLAHDALANRAARIAEVESRSDVFPKGAKTLPDDVPVVHAEPSDGISKLQPVAKSRAPLVVTIGVAVLLLVGVGIFYAARGGTTPPVTTTMPSATATMSAAPPVASTAVPAVTSAAPELSTPPTATTTAAATARATATTVATATAVKPPPVRPADKCNPPFTIDSSGIKHVKPECM